MAWKPDYTTLARAKDYARITDTVDDVELAVWITAASRAVDFRCNRQFGQAAAAVARTYRKVPVYDPEIGLWRMAIDDVQDSTGLLVGTLALASSGAVLLPDSAPLEGRPWTALGLNYAPIQQSPGYGAAVTVTAKWGWTAVPVQAEAAVWLQLARWSTRRDAPSGVVGSPSQGSELRFLARLDPDVATTLSGLVRPRRPH